MMLRRLTLQGVSRRSFVSTSRTVRISPKTSAKKDDGIKKEDITAATKVDTATMAAAKELVDNNVGPFPASDSFDQPFQEASSAQDWSRSFHGLSTQPFSREIANVLQEPIAPDDVEITPDGLLYLPEIKYRRILNRAFGPGGWGLAPRGDHSINKKNISREYALVCHGRFVSQARGEQDFFDITGLPTASEGCKSNALMRCCKDLGIASELWDPTFIRKFKKKHCVDVWAEHVVQKRKKKLWRRKDSTLDYPYKELSQD
ncbi:mitochondrial genome maintenance MGM101 [Lichtheimia hyalospora FSU 10163]|nr:mitochondrial genome maintenance MGM101 [Lichtheimia hyalospora FSU 10163]